MQHNNLLVPNHIMCYSAGELPVSLSFCSSRDTRVLSGVLACLVTMTLTL